MLNDPIPTRRYVWRLDHEKMTGTTELPNSRLRTVEIDLQPIRDRGVAHPPRIREPLAVSGRPNAASSVSASTEVRKIMSCSRRDSAAILSPQPLEEPLDGGLGPRPRHQLRPEHREGMGQVDALEVRAFHRPLERHDRRLLVAAA